MKFSDFMQYNVNLCPVHDILQNSLPLSLEKLSSGLVRPVLKYNTVDTIADH